MVDENVSTVRVRSVPVLRQEAMAVKPWEPLARGHTFGCFAFRQ